MLRRAVFVAAACVLGLAAWAQDAAPVAGGLPAVRDASAIAMPPMPIDALRRRADWRPTGARRPDAKTEKRVAHLRRPYVPQVAVRDLPSSVKNLTYLPSVYRQTFGSCAAFAVTYYHKTYQEAREHGWVRPDPTTNPERVMSPAFTYNLAHGGSDDGSTFPSNYGYLIDYGAATCATMDPNADWRPWPTEAQWRDAHRQRAAGFSSINITTTEGLDTLKQVLAGGDIVTFAMTLYNNFVSYPTETTGVRDNVLFAPSGGVYDPPGDYIADHALTVVGYDDNKVYRDDSGTTHTGAVLVVNSWGTSFGAVEPDFGTGGFIWIAYDYMRSYTWGEVYTMQDRIGWEPDTFLLYDFSHERVAEMYITLKMGNQDSPLWSREVLPRQGGVRGMNARVVVDISDYRDEPVFSYWLDIGDVDIPSLWSPAATGWITYAHIEKPGQEPWVCPDTPIQTIEVNVEMRHLYANMSILSPGQAVFEEVEDGIGEFQWVDLDQDGAPEATFVRVNESGYEQMVFRNDGAGNFMQTESRFPNSTPLLAWGDLTNDGLPDVAMSAYDYDTSTYLNQVGTNIGNCLLAFQDIPGLEARTYRFAWVDYDNDGDQDLACLNVYADGDVASFRILRNDAGALVDSGVSISPVQDLARMAWADYDRDGWMDVLICGLLYRNTGGAFEAARLLDVGYYCAMAWGDYNNDGWMDLAAGGSAGTSVMRNNGDGTFTTVCSGLPHCFFGSLEWADIDNDGLADLLIAGDQVAGGGMEADKEAAVYRNKGDGTFVDMGLPLPDVAERGIFDRDGHLTAVDIDGDGDLDLCLYGGGEKPYPVPLYTRLYRNRIAQNDAHGRANEPPTPPTTMAVEEEGERLLLKWSGATDAETSVSTGLYYNVRAGWNPGASDLVGCAQWPPEVGGRLRPTLDASQMGLNLPRPSGDRPFFWSVQTVDAGLRGSAWSEAQLWAPTGVLPGDVNQDGQLGSGDLLLTIRMARGQLAPDLARADRNGDGAIDNVDILHMRRMLQQKPAPDAQLADSTRIGPEGGVLSADGFSLTVPAGAFSRSADLSLRRVDIERPFGAGSVSPVWYVEGLPDAFALDLAATVDCDTVQASGVSAMGALGEESFNETLASRKWTHMLLSASTTDRLTYAFAVPAVPQAASSAGRTIQDPYNEITLTLSVVAGYKSAASAASARDGGHFIVYYPESVDDDDAANLATYLETAYSTLKRTYGFSYERRTRWPVTVTVKDLASTVYGYYISSKLGNNYGYMEFNKSKMSDAEEMCVTAGHEFFHLVQALYDNRNRYSKATGPGKQYWLDEACAVWSERVHSYNPAYVPSIFSGCQYDAFFDGMHSEGATAGQHGYGMAPLIQYLIGRQGNTFAKKMYDSLYAGSHPVQALCAHSPDADPAKWYWQFIDSYIRGDLDPFKLSDSDLAVLAPASRRWTLSSTADLDKSKLLAGAKVADLGAILYQFDPGSVPIPAGASFYAGLAIEVDGSLSALKWKAADRSSVGLGVRVRAGRTKMEVANVQQVLSGGYSMLAGVVNDRKLAPYTGTQQCGLRLAILRDRELLLSSGTVTTAIVDSGQQFPTFVDQAGVSCFGLVDTDEYYSFGMHWLWASALGAGERNMEIEYGVRAQSNTIADYGYGGDYDLYTFLGVDGYEMLWGCDGSDYYVSSATGEFSFNLLPAAVYYQGTVYVKYSVLRQHYDFQTDTLSDVSTKPYETPAFVVLLMQE